MHHARAAAGGTAPRRPTTTRMQAHFRSRHLHRQAPPHPSAPRGGGAHTVAGSSTLAWPCGGATDTDAHGSCLPTSAAAGFLPRALMISAIACPWPTVAAKEGLQLSGDGAPAPLQCRRICGRGRGGVGSACAVRQHCAAACGLCYVLCKKAAAWCAHWCVVGHALRDCGAETALEVAAAGLRVQKARLVPSLSSQGFPPSSPRCPSPTKGRPPDMRAYHTLHTHASSPGQKQLCPNPLSCHVSTTRCTHPQPTPGRRPHLRTRGTHAYSSRGAEGRSGARKRSKPPSPLQAERRRLELCSVLLRQCGAHLAATGSTGWRRRKRSKGGVAWTCWTRCRTKS